MHVQYHAPYKIYIRAFLGKALMLCLKEFYFYRVLLVKSCKSISVLQKIRLALS